MALGCEIRRIKPVREWYNIGNNDQLKTNTALQMEAEKIEFKVI